MKIGIPYYGKLWIPLAGLLHELGLEVMLPMADGSRYLKLGEKYAPKEWGLPLKLQLGSYIDVLDLGVEKIFFFPNCFGCRGTVQEQPEKKILRELGYEFQAVTVDFSWKGLWKIFNHVAQGKQKWQLVTGLKRFWWKLKFLSYMEEKRFVYGCVMSDYEHQHYDWLLEELLYRRVKEDLQELVWEVEALFELLVGRGGQTGTRVGLIGDGYSLWVSGDLFKVQDRLLKRGIQGQQFLQIKDWAKDQLGEGNGLQRTTSRRIRPYVNKGWSAEKKMRIDSLIRCQQEGCGGVIELISCSQGGETGKESQQIAYELGIPYLQLHLDQMADQHDAAGQVDDFLSLLIHERKSMENLNSAISV